MPSQPLRPQVTPVPPPRNMQVHGLKPCALSWPGRQGGTPVRVFWCFGGHAFMLPRDSTLAGGLEGSGGPALLGPHFEWYQVAHRIPRSLGACPRLGLRGASRGHGCLGVGLTRTPKKIRVLSCVAPTRYTAPRRTSLTPCSGDASKFS
jgi:hypothetical protein